MDARQILLALTSRSRARNAFTLVVSWQAEIGLLYKARFPDLSFCTTYYSVLARDENDGRPMPARLSTSRFVTDHDACNLLSWSVRRRAMTSTSSQRRSAAAPAVRYELGHILYIGIRKAVFGPSPRLTSLVPLLCPSELQSRVSHIRRRVHGLKDIRKCLEVQNTAQHLPSRFQHKLS